MSIDSHPPSTIQDLSNAIRASAGFIQTVQNAIQHHIPTPFNVSLQFELNKTSAIHNMKELRKHGDELHTYITSNKHSFMGYRFEFRPKPLLEILHHRSWPSLLSQMTKDSSWLLFPISEEDRKATKKKEFIARGNHKSVIIHHSISKCIIDKEVKQGWMIPNPCIS
jgi:hypothetical protein